MGLKAMSVSYGKAKIIFFIFPNPFGCVAPIGRAADSKSVGCRFESCHARPLLMLLALLFYSTPVSAFAWHLNWSLVSRRVSGDQVSSTLFGFQSNIFAKHKISSTVTTEGHVLFNLNQGSSRALYNDEFAPRKEISLQQAIVRWEPILQFSLHAGILSSDRLNAPLLISPSQPVMGTSQSFHKKLSENASFHIRLQQSIPGEREKFYRVGQIDKGIPTFLLETLELQYKNLSLTIGHFAYDRLSHTTAYESQFMGNSVYTGTKETAAFPYSYKGYMLNGAFRTSLFLDFDLHMKTHYLHNTHAPQKRNDGFLSNIGIRTSQSGIYGKYFFNRTDSSPAIYNDKFYGHNNKHGFGMELFWKDPLKNYRLKFDFIRSQVLDRSFSLALHQSDTDIAKISITFTPPQFSDTRL